MYDDVCMAIDAVKHIVGRALPLPGADVDTDRIIPARFLKCVTFADLAEGMFYDERFEPDGVSKGHVIDDEDHSGARIMLVGSNFGCGSSREHAPQSIKRFGFDAIVGVSFAEIFFANSTNLGMPCVCVSEEDSERLMAMAVGSPGEDMEVDLLGMEVRFCGDIFKLSMPEGAREALISGQWDSIQELVSRQGRADLVAAGLPYVGGLEG